MAENVIEAALRIADENRRSCDRLLRAIARAGLPIEQESALLRALRAEGLLP
jgi:hypothetical protein